MTAAETEPAMKYAALLIPIALLIALFIAPTVSAPLAPEGEYELPEPAPSVEIAPLPAAIPQSPEAKRRFGISTLPTPVRFPATLPTRGPTAVALLAIAAEEAPRETPEPARDKKRKKCDPAYPDRRTCIPPGPPFAQGCAITDERLFTVLPPDPQRLDHDNDGIGCEPIGGSA